MSGYYYIYSFAQLGIPAGVTPVAGNVFTTTATPTPSYIHILDGDPTFDGTNAIPGSPFVNIIDPAQVLASNLVVDGAVVGYELDDVALGGYGGVIGFVTAISVAIVDPSTGIPTVVGFVTTGIVPPNTAYTIQNGFEGGGVPYSVLANCFTRDTMIECENGPVAVQDIAAGALVITRYNGLQAVRWAGCRKVAGRGVMAPVKVKAGALGNVVDLRFSPMHRVLIRGARAEVLFGAPEVLAHAAHLCDGDRIFRAPCEEVEYFHILFDNHEIIRAHGCWSESFAPSAAALEAVDESTRAEVLKLFPELDQDWQDALPTLSALEAAMARC